MLNNLELLTIRRIQLLLQAEHFVAVLRRLEEIQLFGCFLHLAGGFKQQLLQLLK